MLKIPRTLGEVESVEVRADELVARYLETVFTPSGARMIEIAEASSIPVGALLMALRCRFWAAGGGNDV